MNDENKNESSCSKHVDYQSMCIDCGTTAELRSLKADRLRDRLWLNACFEQAGADDVQALEKFLKVVIAEGETLFNNSKEHGHSMASMKAEILRLQSERDAYAKAIDEACSLGPGQHQDNRVDAVVDLRREWEAMTDREAKINGIASTLDDRPGIATCIFCRENVGWSIDDAPARDHNAQTQAYDDHLKVCKQHPMREVEVERDDAILKKEASAKENASMRDKLQSAANLITRLRSDLIEHEDDDAGDTKGDEDA